MGREKKKNKAGIHSPDGQKEKKKEKKKRKKQVSEAPLGMGKRLSTGIRGPDGPRNKGFLVKSRYPWPRWAKEKEKKE